MDSFDLMSSEHFHVILHSDKKHGLIFNRLDQSIATINYDDAKELSNLRLVERVFGIVGKFLKRYLILIKSRSFVGTLYDPNTRSDHQVYVINQVSVIDIASSSSSSMSKLATIRYDLTSKGPDANSPDSLLKDLPYGSDNPATICHENDYSSLPITISTNNYSSMQSRTSPWNYPFKLANSIKTKMPTQLLRSAGLENTNSSFNNDKIDQSTASSSNTPSQQQSSTDQAGSDDSDKRLIEEMMKLFNNTNSFYFSPTLDLTNRFSNKTLVKNSIDAAIWRTADERFFWNKYMLNDFIDLSKNDKDANCFITIILQGFIAIEHYTVPLRRNHSSSSTSSLSGIENGTPATIMNSTKNPFNSSNNDNLSGENFKTSEKLYKLALVSRRSVFQAGTRYRRRGCDDEGNCANYVETEQIFQYNRQFNSFIIIRGSIPLYWYQSGHNYRPPPVLFKSEEENHVAFKKHFDNLMNIYQTDQIIAIDCTEHAGREKGLHDAYKIHLDKLKPSYSRLKLIEFDFHRYCRGRQCSDLQVEKHLKACGLSESIMKDVKYYWNDNEVVWQQDGIFRVNCIDCTDRTNVVQRAVALQMLDTQLARLGVIAPDTCPEDNNCRRIMSTIWSNNGNVLSTQYCGTRALFTGDKRISGYLKDTYSSASRYYISKFRDAYRQAAIDAMLGVTIDPNSLRNQAESSASGSTSDHYEMINLNPIFLEKSGGALLKDVGNRVSNRLARLKGKLYVKPFNLESMGMSRVETTEVIDEVDEGRITNKLDCLNIDWPSSEDVLNAHEDNQTEQVRNVFSELTKSNDEFQDEEFSQLMLSTDSTKAGLTKIDKDTEREICEEIDMTETRGFKQLNNSDEATSNTIKTSTTST